MDRSQFRNALTNYVSTYQDEVLFIPRFLALIDHLRAYHRDHLPGHLTGSAWIIDEAAERVLLTHHAKLDRWLQPGGHADGEEDIVDVALKEAREETGLTRFVKAFPGIFDIDIHKIPARKDFPEHDHYDVRILLIANSTDTISISPESHDVRWISINDIPDISCGNISMIRMADKVRNLITDKTIAR